MYHTSVLLKESIEALNVRPGGIYVDLTYGGGGHSSAILSCLEQGKLAAFDCDEDAEKNLIHDERLVFINQNFRFLKNFLKYYKLLPVDGMIADLGVSSHQFDTAERGFSIRHEGPFDLRMDRSLTFTAAKMINEYKEGDLIRVFSEYGEIENARTLVKTILKHRAVSPIMMISEFKNTISSCMPLNREYNYLSRVFQAIRIEINGELDALKDMLKQSSECLKPGGRIVVITYHSLEDRIVKNFFRAGNAEGVIEKDFYGNILSPLIPVNRKPVTPGEQELKMNNRARSAKMRIAEKK